MSSEKGNVAEAEALRNAEGKMCGAARRGADAPPGSKTRSLPKGMRWNLGDLLPPAAAEAVLGRAGKLEESKAGQEGRRSRTTA